MVKTKALVGGSFLVVALALTVSQVGRVQNLSKKAAVIGQTQQTGFSGSEFVPGEIIIKLKPYVPPLIIGPNKVPEVASLPSAVRELNRMFPIRRAQKVFSSEGDTKFNLSRVYKLVFGESAPVFEITQTLINDPDVEYAELNYIVRTQATTFSKRVNQGSDDAEENLNTGSVSLSDGDLEIGYDALVPQIVGMRFRNIQISQGATITNAYLEFQVDEIGSLSTSVSIWGEARDNSATFTTSSKNVSGRPKTAAKTNWSIPAWTTVGSKQKSPNISPVIGEIVKRSGWRSGNALTLLIQGIGKRTAESYNGTSTGAPLLVVEYMGTSPTPTRTPTPTPVAGGWYTPDGTSCNSTNYIAYFSQPQCNPVGGSVGFRTQNITPQSACSTDGSGVCFKVGGNSVSATMVSQFWYHTNSCSGLTPSVPAYMFNTLYQCNWRSPTPTPVFSDPFYRHQWALNNTGQTGGTPDADIDALEAWAVTKGLASVVIVVIDTGVDYTHRDLGRCLGPTCKVIGGYDFVNNDPDPMDDHGHGTHVAGIVAATGGNSRGIVGVCPGCKLMAVKFLAADGTGTTEGALAAIEYAVNNGAKILNNSWGGGPYTQSLQDIINWATANGVLVVAAAGNFNNEQIQYPAGFNNVLSVVATTNNDTKASYSTYGRWVDISAPGGEVSADGCRYPIDIAVLSTIWSGIDASCGLTEDGGATKYVGAAGTSMAAPHTSGVAGLVWSKHPTLSLSSLLDKIKYTTDDIYAKNPSYVGKLGTGRLNAYGAVAGIPRATPTATATPTPTNTPTPGPSQTPKPTPP